MRSTEAASESALHWLEQQQLSILDPNRKPWERYPLTGLGVGPIHGLCIGSLVGLGEFYFGDWAKSARQGALIGSLGGMAVVMLIYAFVFAVFIVWKHGPRIESCIRSSASRVPWATLATTFLSSPFAGPLQQIAL
jgi:hypothetical protein